MLKHIYSIPSIKVMSVDTEDILTTWSGGHEATGAGGGQLTGGSVGSGVKQDYFNDADSKSGEDEGAKGISFDFE